MLQGLRNSRAHDRAVPFFELLPRLRGYILASLKLIGNYSFGGEFVGLPEPKSAMNLFLQVDTVFYDYWILRVVTGKDGSVVAMQSAETCGSGSNVDGDIVYKDVENLELMWIDVCSNAGTYLR